jgi:8-oxo-dGTP pyrophosphatase MutT (NUDIX family)
VRSAETGVPGERRGFLGGHRAAPLRVSLATREYLGHPGAVAVVAVAGGTKKDPELLFVRQYRYPVKEVTLELPAGKLDPRGIAPGLCVNRELEEETGFRASTNTQNAFLLAHSGLSRTK